MTIKSEQPGGSEMNGQIRLYVAAALLALSLIGSLGTYFQYSASQTALHDARDALTRARENRKAVQLLLCKKSNQLVGINNRDRQTFLNSQASTAKALPEVKRLLGSLRTEDGQLIGGFILQLFEGSVASTKKELDARPYIAPVPSCKKLVNGPGGQPVKS